MCEVGPVGWGLGKAGGALCNGGRSHQNCDHAVRNVRGRQLLFRQCDVHGSYPPSDFQVRSSRPRAAVAEKESQELADAALFPLLELKDRRSKVVLVPVALIAGFSGVVEHDHGDLILGRADHSPFMARDDHRGVQASKLMEVFTDDRGNSEVSRGFVVASICGRS